MKLIDADAWKLDLLLLHGTNEKTAWLINRINHAPTVDAIPVEWLLNEWEPKEWEDVGYQVMRRIIADWAERKEE